MESVKTIPLSSIAEKPISPPARSVESAVAMPWLVQPIGRLTQCRDFMALGVIQYGVT
jgi:hypothetical protein